MERKLREDIADELIDGGVWSELFVVLSAEPGVPRYLKATRHGGKRRGSRVTWRGEAPRAGGTYEWFLITPTNQRIPVYVGEATNLEDRIEAYLTTESRHR